MCLNLSEKFIEQKNKRAIFHRENVFLNTHQKQKHTNLKLKNNSFFYSRLFSNARLFFYTIFFAFF